MEISTRILQTTNQGGNLQPLAPLNQPPQVQAALAVKSLLALRGASKDQRIQTFGQVGLHTAALALGSIPGIGTLLATGLGLLAGTGEGKRLINAVGRSADQVYQAQKSLFQGDLGGVIGAFEGGSSHKQREATFYGAVTARIQELQTKGGVLTDQDIAGFKQAIAYGDVKPLGTDVDLTKVDLVAGTNPFGGPAGTAPELTKLDLLAKTGIF